MNEREANEQGPALEITDPLMPQGAEALANLLDIEVPGATLPPLWHWAYLLDRPRQSDLGADGHRLSGIPAPPGPGQRRMFAGGQVTTHRELRLGEPATRRTSVVSTVEKTGRTGPLTFVTVRHEITQAGRIAIVEHNDIVYRDEATQAATADRRDAHVEPIPDRSPKLDLRVDETLLFRFSALTYNAHRIHYDHTWARLEGYADLVVHGPLQALMMAELARRFGSGLVGARFSYRLTRPMIGPQTLTVLPAVDGLDVGLEVRSENGSVTAAGLIEPNA